MKDDGASSEVNFSLFISTLALQAYVALGEVPDPGTKDKRVNLGQAKYMIDMLEIIENKTKGNLTNEEEEMLRQALYELRVKFMEKNAT